MLFRFWEVQGVEVAHPKLVTDCRHIAACLSSPTTTYYKGKELLWFLLFSKYTLLITLLQLSQFFLPFLPSPPCNAPQSSSIPPSPEFMSMGHKFFDFFVSYTILNLPPSVLCLPIMLLICCTFSTPFSSFLSSLITLHIISVYVILFLF